MRYCWSTALGRMMPLHPDFLAEFTTELKARCVKRGKFISSSGKKSSYIIDCKPFILSTKGQYLVGHIMKNRLPKECKAVAGFGLGGYALASAISYASNCSSSSVHALYVREKAKKYGTKSAIEGLENIKNGSSVAVVEDVTTTGKSALEASKILRRAGCQVDTVVSVVDRGEGAKEKLETEALELISLTCVEDLLK